MLRRFGRREARRDWVDSTAAAAGPRSPAAMGAPRRRWLWTGTVGSVTRTASNASWAQKMPAAHRPHVADAGARHRCRRRKGCSAPRSIDPSHSTTSAHCATETATAMDGDCGWGCGCDAGTRAPRRRWGGRRRRMSSANPSSRRPPASDGDRPSGHRRRPHQRSRQPLQWRCGRFCSLVTVQLHLSLERPSPWSTVELPLTATMSSGARKGHDAWTVRLAPPLPPPLLPLTMTTAAPVAPAAAAAAPVAKPAPPASKPALPVAPAPVPAAPGMVKTQPVTGKVAIGTTSKADASGLYKEAGYVGDNDEVDESEW